MHPCAPKNMNLSVKRIEEMVTRKTVPNGRPKPAKKAAKEAVKSSEGFRRVSKKNESRGGAPSGGARGESLILDGTRLDSAVRGKESDGRPWVEILVDSHPMAVVGMRATAREVADEL